MKKAIWFVAIGISSLTLLASMPPSQTVLHQTVAQLWKPEVAHAAKVTAHLFRSKSLNPIKLARQNRVSQAPSQPTPYALANSARFRSSSLPQ